MTRTLIALALLSVALPAASQTVERRSAPLPVLGEVVGRLVRPAGWGLKPDGEWVEARGSLPSASMSGNRDAYRYARSLPAVEIRPVEANGQTHHVLVFTDEIGGDLGWRNWFVVNEAALDQLSAGAYTTGEVVRVDLPVLFSADHTEADGFIRQFAAYLRGAQSSSRSGSRGQTITFSLFPVTSEGQEVVRFNVSGLEPYGEAPFSREVFDHFYYEVPALDFQAFASRILMP